MAASIDNFSDLEELGIDCKDTCDSSTSEFYQAADHLQTILPDVDNENLLLLYAYYKQGSQGTCNTAKPSWYDVRGKAKWEAWDKLGSMSQKEAQMLYVNTIQKLDPNFTPSATQKADNWVTVSTLQNNEGNDCSKTLVDFIKERSFEDVKVNLKNAKALINKLGEDGLAFIHWAADRGALNVLQLLVDEGADVNLQDVDGQTSLHYASSCGHVDCIKFLLSKGANPNILDNDQTSAAELAADNSIEELFESLL